MQNRPKRWIWAAIVACVVGAVGTFGLIEGAGRWTCDSHIEEVVTGPAGQDVVVKNQECGWMGSSDIESLTFRHSGREWTIFEYERMGIDPGRPRLDVGPSIRWISDKNVTIDIDVVAKIRKQRASADGVAISFNVGEVVYE